MPRPRNVDRVQVVFLDDTVQVNVDEVQPRRRAPVAEQARLDVRQLERLLQERIVVQINLADRDLVRRAPPGVHLAQQFRCQRLTRDFDPGWFHDCFPLQRS
jgi:shikimate kinase